MTDLLTIAENVARAVMPDLAGLPLYIVGMSDCRQVFPQMGTDCVGQYNPQLARALRPQLEATGRWQGDGPAVAIDLPAIWSEVGNSEFAFTRSAVGIVLHELIHWLERPPLVAIPEIDNDVADVQSDLLKIETAYATASPLSLAICQLVPHGPRFTRLAAHTAYRTRHSGPLGVDYTWLRFAGDYPGLEHLGSPGDYAAALGDELHDRRNESLRTIAASDPPQQFSDLWAAGVKRLLKPHAA